MNMYAMRANICVELKNCQTFAVCLHDKMINGIHKENSTQYIGK